MFYEAVCVFCSYVLDIIMSRDVIVSINYSSTRYQKGGRDRGIKKSEEVNVAGHRLSAYTQNLTNKCYSNDQSGMLLG